jgi:hypothetical protein
VVGGGGGGRKAAIQKKKLGKQKAEKKYPTTDLCFFSFQLLIL